MRILMLVATSVATDTRVLREASALVNAGHTVHIIGKAVPAGFQPPAGVIVSSAGRPPMSAGRPATSRNPVRSLLRWLMLPAVRSRGFGLWADEACALATGVDFDAVHAHDFTALEVGAQLAHARDVPLIYDSHELWSGRQRQYRPTPITDRKERALERRLGAQAVAVITVGEGVAAALRDRFHWPHVHVVRNTFPLAAAQPGSAARSPAGIVYAGRIDAHRELETVIAASALLDLPVTLIGPADEGWLARHRDALRRAGVTVEAPLPVDGVTSLLRDQGLALITHTDAFESYRLAMPNKLFHAVHAGVPVVASDAPAVKELVERHHLGQTYRIGDPADLARAAREVIASYPEYLTNVAAAAPALSWDADAHTLTRIYDNIAASRNGESGANAAG